MSGIRGKRYIDEEGNVVLTGGLKAAKTNIERQGKDFYARIGAIGGKKGTADGVVKGFAAMPTKAVKAAGRKGGKISKRGPAKNKPKTAKPTPAAEEPPKKKRRWLWSK